MKNTIAMLLAGGVGSRLNILAHYRAKPAVPFGGLYRIIDFALSNARNSGLVRVGVLTQYKPLSLMEHVGNGEPWDFIGRLRGAKILPPRTGEKDSDWYKGTADAIRQNIDFILDFKPKRVLILSGDHIYLMNYRKMVDFHIQRKADMTVAMMRVPDDQTHHFGIGITDEHDRIVEWEEKPEQARSNLASMGVYVFDTGFLLECLNSIHEHDFGKHIITKVIKSHQVYAFPFAGYWRDVGTLFSFWNANMDLLRPDSGLNLREWKVFTNLEEEGMIGDRAPTRIAKGAIVRNSFISQGCHVEGQVENSILSPGVRVSKGARVSNSVIMHDSLIGAGAKLNYIIADKLTEFGPNCVAGVEKTSAPNQKFPNHLREGLTVVGKNAIVPASLTIGGNCIVYPRVNVDCYDGKTIKDGATVEL